MNTQRGSKGSLRRLALPVVACALTLVVGCGGGTGAPTGGDGGGGTVTLDPPTLSAITPDTGATQGGTLVTITGTNFLTSVTGATTVTFDGVEATEVTVVDDTTLTAITPEGAANDTHAVIKIVNSRGTATLLPTFHYLSTASIVSDLNDDGIPDVVVSAAYDATNGTLSGSVYVFFGEQEMSAPSVHASVAGTKLVGAAINDRFGSSIATGDVNGDGVTDLLVSSPRADLPVSDAGSVSIFLGPLGESSFIVADEADIVLTGEGTVPGDLYGSTGDNFGQALTLGDANGDGVLDVLVGAPGTDLFVDTPAELEDAGRAYLFLGGATLTSRSALDADVVISGEIDEEQLATALCLADLDGDGKADVAIAGEVDSPILYIGGFIHIFRGEGLVSASTSAADFRLVAEDGGDEFGSALACGFINGDGVEDLVVGAPFTDTLGSATGRTYVFFGSTDFGDRDASLADVIYSGQPSNTGFGVQLAVADLNGDEFDDVLVGAPRTSFGAQKNGRVFGFFGAEHPMDELSHFSDVIYTGEEIDGERFGSAIEVLDCDGDGIADLMSSAVGHDQAAGRVYVFHGAEALVDVAAVNDDLTLTGESEGGNFGFSISRGK